MTGLLLAAALSVALPGDGDYRAALDLVYDGSFDLAQERLAALSAAAPDDPVALSLQALALCWRLEQRPESDDLDGPFLRRVEAALAGADARLRQDASDARARLAKGAAFGVRSRYHIFRQHRGDAAKDAVRMREELRRAREIGVTDKDVRFGLGLYDYYADVLPKFVKLLRFFAGMPGGDRERGLAAIEESTEGSLFHDTEARIQLYEIYAFYEDRPDRALGEIEWMRTHHPGWPLWALKLAEHLRERLGLYARAAEVAQGILETAEHHRHPNYQPVVAVMARIALGEALLLDLRFHEARTVLLPAREGSPEAPYLAARARLALGRSLELEDDRDAALAHYRLALSTSDRELRRQVLSALASPLSVGEVRAAQLLADVRRFRERGSRREAAERARRALEAWPKSQEAALRVAEDDLEHGRAQEARRLLNELDNIKVLQPPWVRPWSWLLRGRLHDLKGERAAALDEYKRVLLEPYGREELRELATDGLQHPYAPQGRPPGGPSER